MAVKLREMTPILVRNYMAGINTFMNGKPAIGKTMTIDDFVAKMQERVSEFKAWKFYAPTMSPMDIQASAPDTATGLLRMYNNEALPNAYTHPDAKGVIFFGELPNADQTTTKLLQKYINGEDMSGVLRKPDGIVCVADGNRLADKSSVQQQGRAFMSRWDQYEVYTDAQDNIDYAMKHAWHPLVQTFFKDHPDMIDNYDEVFMVSPDAREKAAKGISGHLSEEGKMGIWANMRAWDAISRKENVADQMGGTLMLAEMTGRLGHGVGMAYDAHKRMLAKLASFEDIMRDPKGMRIPTAMDEQYALCVLVALRCKEDQLAQVHQFGTRMPLELQAAMLRNMAQRKGFNLASGPAYMTWISDAKLAALLNGR